MFLMLCYSNKNSIVRRNEGWPHIFMDGGISCTWSYYLGILWWVRSDDEAVNFSLDDINYMNPSKIIKVLSMFENVLV